MTALSTFILGNCRIFKPADKTVSTINQISPKLIARKPGPLSPPCIITPTYEFLVLWTMCDWIKISGNSVINSCHPKAT
jgi:hypothetical protein